MRPLAFVLAALTAVLAFYLLRDVAAIWVVAPLDPNEGWNAVFTARAMTGAPLYADGSLVNNYPPLSFYIVGAVGKLTGDFIVAGRLMSLATFLASVSGIFCTALRMGAGRLPAAFAALFFAAILLLASNYVAMDDPQLLGHALQLGALWLLLRRTPAPTAAALLFVASLFVKHNLIALPLSATAFLLLEDRRMAARFMLTGLTAGLAGLFVFHLVTGQNLIALLASPRAVSFGNFAAMMQRFLSWAGVPLVLSLTLFTRLRTGKPVRFVMLYLGFALAVGALFAPGDGVDANIFFDAAIALSFAGALLLQDCSPARAAVLAMAMVAPLLMFAALHFEDDNFAYTPDFRAQAARDIAFLKSHPGPGLCEMLSLCVWAQKPASVDVFNTGETFKMDARDDRPMAELVAARHFAVIQFDALEPFALGPRVKATLTHAYRLDHSDDNGFFFVPRAD